MYNQQQQPGQQIDLNNTEAVFNSSGSPLFLQGVIVRKVSKFITGTAEDSLISIPVFYDPETKQILENTLPPELREEFEEHYKNNETNED